MSIDALEAEEDYAYIDRLRTRSRPTSIGTGNPGLAHFIGRLALPLASPATLFLSTLVTQQHFGPRYVVLGLLAFFMQYPGRWAKSRQDIHLGQQVVSPWLTLILILAMVGFPANLAGLFHGPTVLVWAIATPVVQSALLFLLPTMLRGLVSLHRQRHVVIVVGAAEAGQRFANAINQDPITHTKVIGFFDDRAPERLGALDAAPLLGSIRDIGAYVRRHHVDQIYISLPTSSDHRMLELLRDLKDCTASIYFVPDISSIDLIQPRVDTHAGFPVISVCESPFHGLNALAKRLSDLLIAAVATLVLSPVMALIALAIKIDSPGPVLFKQRRFGLDGSEIVVWKFRSMSVTEDGASTYKQVVRNDPRVTRLGALLRKTSLDELPQFINVLQGRMSIVGPRPHALRVNEQYRRLIPGYMVRHKVRPGITGWAQVNGYRGGDDLDSMTKRIEHDLAYLRDWSIWLDLQILLRTATLVVRDSTAY